VITKYIKIIILKNKIKQKKLIKKKKTKKIKALIQWIIVCEEGYNKSPCLLVYS